MPGLIRTRRRAQVTSVNRRIPHNRNAELNLKFYLEGNDDEWKKMQRPWSAIRSYYGRVKVKLVAKPYVEEVSALRPDDVDSSSSEDDISNDTAGREDDTDAAESCEFEDADELEKKHAEVREAMLQGAFSFHDVMQALRCGLVENDAAHAYVAALEANVVLEELIRPDQTSSASELRTKHCNDPVVSGTSSSAVARAGDARMAAMESRAAAIARLQADLAREKAKGK